MEEDSLRPSFGMTGAGANHDFTMPLLGYDIILYIVNYIQQKVYYNTQIEAIGMHRWIQYLGIVIILFSFFLAAFSPIFSPD